MTPLGPPSRSHRAAAVAGLLLVCVAAGEGQAAPAARPPAASESLDLGPQLAEARAENDAAEAALEAARRVLTPGHLLDPLPARLMAGLGELQAEYAEMERKAAGYRATLGDQHPTLKGAEDVLSELRRQIVDGARRAVATAQGDATRTRAAVATLERRARTADATGSTASPAAPVVPLPPAAGETIAGEAATGLVETPTAPREPSRAPRLAPPGRALPTTFAEALPVAFRHPWIVGAAGLAAGAAALGLLAGLVRRRRAPALAPVRIEPAAPVDGVPVAPRPGPVPSTPASAVAAVPVLAVLPMEAGDDPAAVRARLGRLPDAALAHRAASVFATLAAAAGPDPESRIGVTVAAVAGATAAQADAAALALAAAAAAAGRRVLLVDGHPDPRLGRILAPGAAPIAVFDRGDRIRHLLRLAVGGGTIALLSDAAAPAAERAPACLPNLDGFDAIVTVGGLEDIAVVSAGLALLVAACDAPREDLAAAARIAAGASGRPCGVLLVEIEDRETAVAVPAEPPRSPEAFPARRRGPETATARLGLRRTFDPARRVAKRAG